MVASPADERIHPVVDASEHWSDSLYFNLWDPASGLFLLTRMAVLPNRPAATAGVLAWLDGQPAYGYSRNIDELPGGDWDDLRIGGLRYREVDPLRAWEISLVDGENRADVRWTGFTGVIDYRDNSAPLPRAVAWGHYEQTCAVVGEVEIRGRRIQIDGVGQRDHSWGFRHWGGVAEWHWITGFLGGTERSFNLFHVVQPDGTVTANGFVHDRGDDLLIVGAERRTDEDAERSPQRFELALEVEDGRRFVVRGTGHGTEVPVRPGGESTVVHERMVQLESDDGLVGHGIYELLENSRDTVGR